ncbi:MAG TPA: formylglycine-generating enzyme family protein, partial [Planctomycetaceae bacterium]|nr:formylglycine-generating enzyme family protein [Planctomycetaceae bacterium]
MDRVWRRRDGLCTPSVCDGVLWPCGDRGSCVWHWFGACGDGEAGVWRSLVRHPGGDATSARVSPRWFAPLYCDSARKGDVPRRFVFRFRTIWRFVMSSTTTNTTVGWKKASVEADLTLSIPNGDESRISIFFRKIDEGSFRMGSRAGHYAAEEPIHTVKISEFYMGTFPVTQEQWQAVVEACQQQGLLDGDFDPSPSGFREGEPAHLRPVEQVSWDDVKKWLAGANELLKIKDGISVKWNRGEDSAGRRTPLVLSLPTEAEWECACRAGTETEYYTGDGEAALDEAGWYHGNSDMKTHPVGEKEPNAF